MSEPIIIEIPSPTCRARFVLVHVGQCSGTTCGIPRDATPADLLRGGYGKLPMWVTSAADGQKLIGERDEARAAFLGCAQAIGIVCQADGHADEPGPPAAVIAAIKGLAKRVEDLESELATANEWRERWCRESEAAAAQSNANWQRAKDLEARAEKAEALHREACGHLDKYVHDAVGHNALVAILAKLFGWEDTSFLHAILHVENAVLNQRADLAVEKARADQAEREFDGACSPDCQARIDYVEADNAKLRDELARLTAPGEGELTPSQILDACPPAGGIERLLACYRLGVAHERARHEKDRATDEELLALFNSTVEANSKTMAFPVRSAVAAVAARVRQERPGIDEEAVGEVMRAGLAQCDALRSFSAKFRARCDQFEGERNAIAFVLSTPAERRKDAQIGSLGYATLARLLGEVSR